MEGPQLDELKELVKGSLQQNGVLASLKAQLRAAVFKVVNDEAGSSRSKSSAIMESTEGALAVDLIREFMEFYELHSTISVLLPEASLEVDYPGRSPLAVRLGLEESSKEPLLIQMLRSFMTAGSNKAHPSAPETRRSLDGHQKEDNHKQSSPVKENKPSDGNFSSSPPTLSPHRDGNDRDSKFSFGAEKKSQPTRNLDPPKSRNDLSPLSDLPPLPGMKPNKHVFSFPSSRGVQELEEVAKLSPPEFPRSDKATSDATHSGEKEEEEEEYNSLTSTTRRLYPKKDDNVDLERGKSPAASENVSPKATNGNSDYDVVEEDIEVQESDGEVSPAWGLKPQQQEVSLSESCTEVSMSDRSVEGSMTLDAYDHIESLAR
ncbi:hypothetical protein GUITHDRAFT_101957 [Guillardia theta CCMP2712]|uniref:FGFR1 oncogene partner (FOP) N-terminal dimerisation domain-containing protein n=1 Tax=Guillardia theta (strain CCMP2712) TaxID=905079 RepID=L1JUP3_GUITC|nr:hypothetical protein GUITHDRAFT_101957 [Guillardia theta CCMP2712]EKX52049.1 hypothetical protein GUITHDRAFT_101957 [Guillardia theta CCMP2712]|eukprot:XP_005839029.1 hypothetical protein GUITHDRAFT_101957 [Guillardia theta CCMP2712]